MSNDDDRDRPAETENAKEHLKQGLGLLFQAAREAATGIKKEIDRTNFGKSIDDAGRELARAANNVVGRIEKEIKKVQPSEPSYVKRPDDPQDPQPWSHSGPGPREDEKRDGNNNPREDEKRQGSPDKKPKGPTKDDPGFWIATPDGSDDSKPQ